MVDWNAAALESASSIHASYPIEPAITAYSLMLAARGSEPDRSLDFTEARTGFFQKSGDF
jgi:hypothetical protein